MNQDRIYQGLIKGRKNLDEIMGAHLPEKAVVLFAYGVQRWTPIPDGGPDEGTTNILVFWAIDRKFFSANGQCLWYWHTELERHAPTPFQIEVRRVRDDPRHLLASLDGVAEHEGWPAEYRHAFKGIYKRMIRLVEVWERNPEDSVAEETMSAEEQQAIEEQAVTRAIAEEAETDEHKDLAGAVSEPISTN